MKMLSLLKVGGLSLAILAVTACGNATPAPAVLAIAATGTPVAQIASQPAVTDTPTLVPTDTPTIALTNTPTNTPTNTATSTPTNTPTSTATPTNTPVPPTPTRTRVPATATRAPLTLTSALAKNGKSKSYRFMLAETYSDPYRSYDMLQATGERSGGTMHVSFGGWLSLLLGSGGQAELIYQGDKVYAKGPLILLRANEARWYLLPPGKTNLKPNAPLELTPADFSKIGTEAVDGLNCDIYTIDKPTAIRALQASGTLPVDQVGNVVNVEVTYWVCSDGYVHQYLTRVDVRDRNNPSTTDIVKIITHYFDFNATIQVPEPTDPLPLPQ